MKRYLTILILPFVLGAMATGASADGVVIPYGWTLSDSETDPFANQGTFLPGLLNLKLWFTCSTAEPEGPGGMASAEFAVINLNPANLILSVTPKNGFLNAGPPPLPTQADLLLAVGGCPTGWNDGSIGNAATILCLVNAPGAWMIGPAANGNKVTVDCAASPQVWPMQWIGYTSDGTPPAEKDWDKCTPKIVSVDQESWGGVKAMYR